VKSVDPKHYGKSPLLDPTADGLREAPGHRGRHEHREEVNDVQSAAPWSRTRTISSMGSCQRLM
jgi:hypothetical protein